MAHCTSGRRAGLLPAHSKTHWGTPTIPQPSSFTPPPSIAFACLPLSPSMSFFYSHLKCANEVFTNIEYFVVGNPAMLFPHE